MLEWVPNYLLEETEQIQHLQSAWNVLKAFEPEVNKETSSNAWWTKNNSKSK